MIRQPASTPDHTPAQVPLGLLSLLGGLVALGPFSIDMYLSAFPALQAHFHTTKASVQFTLSAYFIGLAVGQMVVGPVTDRVGRRLPLLLGLVIYVLASLGCAVAPTIEALMALRVLQAIGACAGMVVTRAILRDKYSPRDMARVLSQILLVMGVAPIIAPMVGHAVHTAFGWQALFLGLAVYGALLLAAVAAFLAETLPNPGPAQPLSETLQQYGRLLQHRHFMGYSLTGGLMLAGMFGYIASSSFVFVDVLGFTGGQFTALFGLNATGLITASQVNSYLLRRTEPERIIPWVLGAYLLATAALVVGAATGIGGALGLVLPLFIAISSLGFGFPNTTSAAMAPMRKEAGVASALLGTLQFVLAGISSWASGLWFDGTALPLALTMMATALLSVLAYTVFIWGHEPERAPVQG